MKKIVLASAFLFAFAVSAAGQDFSQNTLRESYYAASQNGEAARAFYDKLAAADTSAPLLLGYKGMAGFMVCYHALNPYHKLKYFLEGKTALNRAIAQAPENVELRFLRFTVQTNAPKFLGYYRDILADKSMLLAALADPSATVVLDADLRRRVLAYLGESPYCSRQERAQIEAMLTTDR